MVTGHIASAEHMHAPFMAGYRRIRQLASRHHLIIRPHTVLWLTKAYVLPASMYACQILGITYMKEGAEMDCPLQTVRLCLLAHHSYVCLQGKKGLRQGQCQGRNVDMNPYKGYSAYKGRKASVKGLQSLLHSNSPTLSKVLRADVEKSSLSRKCWTSEFPAASMARGLDRCNTFTHSVQTGQPLVMREFVVDLRKRLRGLWNPDAWAEHGEHTNKIAKCHHWVALPLKPLPVHGEPFSVPRYLYLDLSKHMLRNIAYFRLRAHTLRVKTSPWQEHTSECDRCDQGGLQDRKHAMFL
eukprot:1155164-Pelagomonas_calceolata.AAC.1